MAATLSYTALTADHREAWDTIVSDCAACQASESEEPCGDHDLSQMTADDLDALIAAWRSDADRVAIEED